MNAPLLEVSRPLTRIHDRFSSNAQAFVYQGDCREMLEGMPDQIAHLIVTSPPYNLGKEYERRLKLDDYLAQQAHVIQECVRVTAVGGHICWQVGNFVDRSEIVPLDAVLYPIFKSHGLQLRNRIIWHFEHGLHCSNRFSGRYETILWLTKGDEYHFDLDPVRVPQKYPGKKHFKGPNAGKYSCNPLGKNPGDVWMIPNVKSNHVEKTTHPCQFPVELIERLVLSMTKVGDWVIDPFLGVGSAAVAAVKHGRRGGGAELVASYVSVAKERIRKAASGDLKTRPMHTPVFDPRDAGTSLTTPPWGANSKQNKLFQRTGKYKS